MGSLHGIAHIERVKGIKKLSVALKLYIFKFSLCEKDVRTFLPHQKEDDDGSHI